MLFWELMKSWLNNFKVSHQYRCRNGRDCFQFAMYSGGLWSIFDFLSHNTINHSPLPSETLTCPKWPDQFLRLVDWLWDESFIVGSLQFDWREYIVDSPYLLYLLPDCRFKKICWSWRRFDSMGEAWSFMNALKLFEAISKIVQRLVSIDVCLAWSLKNCADFCYTG